ncbi:transcription elongation factor spt5 [Paramarasmius palmivorus]|uniref:Transcription elongation factor spt5 n=1 Tax=Paramarasmius palmivorus TaxID=297713 RepID=A0AAW0AR85_9AGAR
MTRQQPDSELLHFLDIEAVAESDEDDWESDDEDMERFIDDDQASCPRRRSSFTQMVPINALSNESEHASLQQLAQSYRKIGQLSESQHDHDRIEDASIEDSPWSRLLLNQPDMRMHYASGSTGPRLPYRVGKRSRLTDYPIPVGRPHVNPVHPPIFGKVDWDRLRAEKEKRKTVAKGRDPGQYSQGNNPEQAANSEPPSDVPSTVYKGPAPSRAPHRTALASSQVNVMRQWSRFAERKPNSIHPLRRLREGEWVSICQGLYKGDIGVVWKMKQLSHHPIQTPLDVSSVQPTQSSDTAGYRTFYLVFVVPRLGQSSEHPLSHLIPPTKDQVRTHAKRPRKRRPLPELFNPNLWPRSSIQALGKNAGHFKDPHYQYHMPTSTDQTRWEERCDHSFRVQGNKSQTMVFGLHAVLLAESVLYPANHIPTALGQAFILSCHPLIRSFPPPMPDSWHFQSGDYVQDDESGNKGWLVEMHEQGLATIEVDQDQGFQELRGVTIIQLKKVFDHGDWIKVLAGPNKGKAGFVIAKYGSYLGVIAAMGSPVIYQAWYNPIASDISQMAISKSNIVGIGRLWVTYSVSKRLHNDLNPELRRNLSYTRRRGHH